MTYRQPAFMVNNLGLNLSTSAIVARNGSALTTASKRALIDGRAGAIGTTTATGANGGWIFDLGSIAAGDQVNRAVIPGGHSLAGANLQTVKDTIPGMNGFPSPQIAGFVTVPANYSGPIDFDCTFNATPGYRYFALQWNGSTNGSVISASEYWLGTYKQLSSNAYVQTKWRFDYDQDVVADAFGGRDSTLALAPARKRFSLEVINVDAAGADFAILDAVMSLGRAQSFVYWPPDSDTGGPYIVKLAAAATRSQEFPAPQASMRYAIGLEMVEQLS